MALTEVGLAAVIQGIGPYLSNLDKMEAGEKKVAAGLKDVEGKSSTASGALTKLSIAGTAGLLGLAGIALKMGSDFEHSMDQVGAVAGASVGELKQLSAAAKQIGADTAFSAGDAAKAMEELAAGGRSVAQILGGEARAATDLAAAGNYNLADSARTIATAMTVWEGTTIDTTDVVNRLAGAANTSRFGVDDMSQAIAQGGGVAAQAGVSFQDFSTAIAATAASFSSGSDAGTSFKTFITGLTGNSEKAKDTIKQLGLEFYTAAGVMKPMSEIVQELHDKLGGLSQEQQTVALKTIFGNDAFRTAAGLMKLTGAEFTAMSDKMKNTDAQAVAKQRMDNLQGSMEQLKGSFETVAIGLAERVIPALAKTADEGTKLLNAFGALPSSTQNLALGLTAIAIATPALISGIQKGAQAISGMGAAMQTGRGQAALFAVGLAALAIGADAILTKTTGQGLIAHLMGKADENERAARAVREVNAALAALGEGDKLAGLAARLDRANVSLSAFNDELERGPQNMMDVQTSMAGVKGETKELEANVTATAAAMKANGASTTELWEAYQKLNPALQEAFDKGTDVVAAVNSVEYAMAQGKITTDGWQGSLKIAKEGSKDFALTAGGSMQEVTHSSQELESYMSGTWGPALAEVFDTFDAETQAKLSAIQGKFPDVQISAEGLRSYLKDKFGPDGVKAFDDWRKEIGESFDKMKGALETIFPAVDESFDKWKKRIDQMVTDQKAFEGNLRTIYAGITAAGIAMPDAIIAALADKGPAFVAMFTKLYAEDPQRAIEVLKVAAPAAMGESVDAITNRVIGGAPGMDAAVTALINKPFAEAAEELRNSEEVKIAGEAMLEEALGAMAVTAHAGGSKVGGDIADGVAEGLKAGKDAVSSIGSTVVKGVLDAMKEAAKSKSPSKETAKIGKDMGDGLGVGLVDSQPGVDAIATGFIREVITDMAATVDAESPLVGEAFNHTLAGWRDVLKVGLDTTRALSNDEIKQMFADMASWINGADIDLITRAKMQKVTNAFMEGWAMTGSLSNSALISFFNDLIGLTTDGWDKVAEANAVGAAKSKAAALGGGLGVDAEPGTDAIGSGFESYVGGGSTAIFPITPKVGATVDIGGGHTLVWTGTYWSMGGATPIPKGFTSPGYVPAEFPSFAHGINYVPRTMAALVHQGERIIPASANKPVYSGAPSNHSTFPPVPMITIDQRGATFTGTREENAEMMRTIVEDVLDKQLGPQAYLYGRG